jgi:serine/threonine-protein kinase
MATVYEAVDLRLDRIIALKVMHRHLAEDPDFVARFEREAKSAARLSHPHVVAVYDQGHADGLIYLAMEMVPGRTLRDVMRDYGPLTPEQALVILDPVLEGLAAAHAAGFVHRDIKPENVLLADDGRVKVADFGLARAVSTSNTSATQGLIMGTVAYLSPEQVERGEADERSDLYAAGILLFEMVTGQVPHAGDSPLSVAYAHVNSDVPAPSSIRSNIPPEIDALVVRATRRDAYLRYQQASEFLADVKRIRAMLPPPRPFVESHDTVVVDASTAARLAAGQPVAPNPKSLPPKATSHRGRRRKGPLIALVIALVVLGAGIGGWLLATGKSVPTPNIVGQSTAAAKASLLDVGLSLVITEEQFSEDVPLDLVISSDPAPGDGAREGGAVGVIVSKGPERYVIPDVQGLSVSEATAAITSANLVIGSTTEVFDDQVPAAAVASTSPKIGNEVKPGTSVDIAVSKGPKPVTIPQVVGKKIQVATSALTDLGLLVTTKEKYAEKITEGLVIAIRPAAGTITASGTAVELVVSKGPPPVEVPSLIDLPKNKAINVLKGLGLQPKVLEAAATPLNRVYSQDPPAGTMIPKGSTVIIRII